MRKNKFIYDEGLYPSKAREYVTRILLVTGMTIAAMGIGQCMKEPRQAPAPVAVKASKVETQIHAAFEKAGSPVPQQMTQACMQTQNPKLMAAVAIVESDGTPWAKGKAGERGAWQVIGNHHGTVPNDAVGQALQAERILDELRVADSGRSLRRALAQYNGGTKPRAKSYRYADRVLKIRRTLG